MKSSSQRYLLGPLVSGEQGLLQEGEISFVDEGEPAASLKKVAFFKSGLSYKNPSRLVTFSLPSGKQLGYFGPGGRKLNKHERKAEELVVTGK
jgi:hypothetical protein